MTVADPDGLNEVYYYDILDGGGLIGYNRGNGGAPEMFGYDSAGCVNSVTDRGLRRDPGARAGPAAVPSR